MKLASWNVNSLNVRLPHILKWLEGHRPDALMLQEIKTENVPEMEINALGYDIYYKGQKGYAGVATLVKDNLDATRITDILPGDENDEQARFLDLDINGARIINIYLPNGNPAPGPKFGYKLAWMDRLIDYAADLYAQKIPFLIAGDFNIIPHGEDCYDPAAWSEDALFLPEARAKWRTLLNIGLYDAFRFVNHEPQQYTFWDYQGGAFAANKGIRIDHFLLSPELADKMTSCDIDVTPRGWDKPSDHTPIICEIAA